MQNQTVDFTEFINAGNDFLSIVIDREEVQAKDFSKSLPLLRGLVSSQRVANHFRERVDISFSGYENHRNELWEIVEVRNYVRGLDSEFPYWAFFLSKHTAGLHCIIQCFLPPFLTSEGRRLQHTPAIAKLLGERWMPALNQVGDFAGIDEHENVKLTDDLLSYLRNGPGRP